MKPLWRRTMIDQALLEALRDTFWPVYLFAVAAGLVGFVHSKRWCLGRVVIALVLGTIAQSLWEGNGYLLPWQHLAIDVPLLFLITMPPRHYWQSTMAGLILAQIFLHVIWWLAPSLAREHWLGCILLGYLKCAVLVMWSGGARVETALAGVSNLAARFLHTPLVGKLAK